MKNIYLNNVTGKPVKDITFEGYVFTIPAGISLAWGPFGRFILDKIYPIAGQGGGMPPVVLATAKQWKGDRYVDVRRFELNASLIPKRADLLKIAKQRGVSAEQLEQWKEDETIENAEIARVINEAAVPDNVKYPEAPAADDAVDTETADAALNTPETAKTDDVDTKVPETAPSAPAPVKTATAPKTGAKGGAKKAADAKPKAAVKTPKTPKTAAPKK